MSDSDVSVIIVSYNTRDFLADCLRSLRRVYDEAKMEVIVVDNASLDGSAEWVEAEFPEVHLIRAPRNLGFAAANNLGIARARAALLLFLNPDALVTRFAIQRLLSFLLGHPEAAIAGANLIYPDGRPQASHFRFPSLFREFWNYWPELKYRFVTVRKAWPWGISAEKIMPFQVECVSGAAFMAKRDIIDSVGGFDSKFFLYHEEMDLCTRIRKQGGQIWTVPDAWVIHWDSQASGYQPNRLPRVPLLEWRVLGMDRLWAKHRSGRSHLAWRIQTKALLRLRIGLLAIAKLLRWGHRLQIGERQDELRVLVQKLSP